MPLKKTRRRSSVSANAAADDDSSKQSQQKQLEPTYEIPEKEIQELREIFQLVDLDGGGTISPDELETLMKTLGMRVTKHELNNIVKEIDKRGTGEIDFDSFVAAMTKRQALSQEFSADDIKSAFRKYMKPHYKPGTILFDDLIEALTNYGDPAKRMTKDDAEYFAKQLTGLNSGEDVFDFDRFVDVNYEP